MFFELKKKLNGTYVFFFLGFETSRFDYIKSMLL